MMQPMGMTASMGWGARRALQPHEYKPALTCNSSQFASVEIEQWNVDYVIRMHIAQLHMTGNSHIAKSKFQRMSELVDNFIVTTALQVQNTYQHYYIHCYVALRQTQDAIVSDFLHYSCYCVFVMPGHNVIWSPLLHDFQNFTVLLVHFEVDN